MIDIEIHFVDNKPGERFDKIIETLESYLGPDYFDSLEVTFSVKEDFVWTANMGASRYVKIFCTVSEDKDRNTLHYLFIKNRLCTSDHSPQIPNDMFIAIGWNEQWTFDHNPKYYIEYSKDSCYPLMDPLLENQSVYIDEFMKWFAPRQEGVYKHNNIYVIVSSKKLCTTVGGRNGTIKTTTPCEIDFKSAPRKKSIPIPGDFSRVVPLTLRFHVPFILEDVDDEENCDGEAPPPFKENEDTKPSASSSSDPVEEKIRLRTQLRAAEERAEKYKEEYENLVTRFNRLSKKKIEIKNFE
jgi:hypothetical protein